MVNSAWNFYKKTRIHNTGNCQICFWYGKTGKSCFPFRSGNVILLIMTENHIGLQDTMMQFHLALIQFIYENPDTPLKRNTRVA